MESISLEALASFGVGHAHDEAAGTGCTVVVAPHGAICGVDVRGGGPATRETDLLKPENMVESVHAVVLSGGSAFGLEASCGVMDVLSEKGIGFRLADACIPIVTGACLFDVLVGKDVHPDKAMGGRRPPVRPSNHTPPPKMAPPASGLLSSRETWAQDAARLWGRWAGPSRL